MIPPQTILEMHKFMHDELHGNRKTSESGEAVAPSRKRRLGQILRALFLRRRSELAAYCEGDQLQTADVRNTRKAM